MSFKKSSSTMEKNKESWTNNLVQFQAPSRRGNVAVYEEPLSDRSRMPLKSHDKDNLPLRFILSNDINVTN